MRRAVRVCRGDRDRGVRCVRRSDRCGSVACWRRRRNDRSRSGRVRARDHRGARALDAVHCERAREHRDEHAAPEHEPREEPAIRDRQPSARSRTDAWSGHPFLRCASSNPRIRTRERNILAPSDRCIRSRHTRLREHRATKLLSPGTRESGLLVRIRRLLRYTLATHACARGHVRARQRRLLLHNTTRSRTRCLPRRHRGAAILRMHRQCSRQRREKISPRHVRNVMLGGRRERHLDMRGRADYLRLGTRWLEGDHRLARVLRIGSAHRACAGAAQVRREVDERVAARQRLVREPGERVTRMHVYQCAFRPLCTEPLRRRHTARQ